MNYFLYNFVSFVIPKCCYYYYYLSMLLYAKKKNNCMHVCLSVIVKDVEFKTLDRFRCKFQ